MKSTAVWGLVILNVLLLAALIGRVAVPNAAFAQQRPAAGAARPGDYLMIPGEVTGGSTSVVYVVDTTNAILGALAYDDATRQLQSMPNRIDLSQVFNNEPVGPRDDKKNGRR